MNRAHDEQYHSLKGLNVLVTRPNNQGESLARAIESRGGRAVLAPLLEISPLEDALALEKIRCLDQYQLAIFISSNAAREAINALKKCGSAFPPALQLLAVGPATASVLEALGRSVTVPATGTQSEDLLKLPQLRSLQGIAIAIFRGRGGRELLGETLRSRGAKVDYIELYERKMPSYGPGEFVALISDNAIDVITVTSAEMLDNLCQLIEGNRALPALIPLLVPSARVKHRARDAGFTRLIEVAGADDQALLKGLTEISLQLIS